MPNNYFLTVTSKRLDLIGKSEVLTKSFETHRKLMFGDIAMPDIFYAQADATLRYVLFRRFNPDVARELMRSSLPDTTENYELRMEFYFNSMVEVKFWWNQGLGSAPSKGNRFTTRKPAMIRALGDVFANYPELPFEKSDHYAFLTYLHNTPRATDYIKAGYRTLEEVKACVDNDLDLEIVRALISE